MNDTRFQRGMLLFQQGRYREAVGELRLELSGGPDDYLPHFALALCLAELGQYDEATDHARQAIHLAPDQPLGFYALAQVMIRRNRFGDARQAIEEAIRLNPYDADYFGILASLEMQASRWSEALAAANQGLQVEPEHVLCTNVRAQALVHLGDRAAAAATMGEALARRPDDAFTHANQGWALLHQGQPRQALDHFREALRIDPDMEWARFGIVEALKARNFVYRWMLAWFLWMARLTPQMRWGLVIGALVGSRVIQQWADKSPELAPYLWPILYAYAAFVLLSWLAPSFFNLLLRFDRFGRYALSVDQVRGANVLAACLAAAAAVLVSGVAAANGLLVFCGVMFLLLALPASAIYVCDEGWPRQAMAGVTILLLAAVLVVAAAALFPPQAIPLLVALPAAGVYLALPWAMLASQFAANYLMSVKPKR